jgi:MoxR-like ATPase
MSPGTSGRLLYLRGDHKRCARGVPYDGVVRLTSVEDVDAALRAESYLPDRGLATAVYLALAMRRPLLLEGEPGVGKTEVAKTLARALGADLVRLQCYEGIDASQALYEWDYSRQLLYARALDGRERVSDLYGPEFLVERPLLRAIRSGPAALLLVDELDRADDEFEAFLLEVLSDFSVTIPELGQIAAADPPAVIVTSNRTRELHDALKRRCLYHWIEFPDLEREVEIIRVRAPEVSEQLARSVALSVARLRELDLVKPPGAAEAIDWARALALLGFDGVDGDAARETLGWAVKNREDLRAAEAALAAVAGD